MRKRNAMNYSFSLTPELIDNVEELAKSLDLTRSEMARIIFNYFYNNPEELEKIIANRE